MERFHDPKKDLPTPAGRDAARQSLDQAMAAFMSNGGQISNVDDCPPPPLKAASPKAEVPRTNAQLRAALQAQAQLGKSLSTIARDLGEPLSRCQSIARQHRIQFRAPFFKKSKKGASA